MGAQEGLEGRNNVGACFCDHELIRSSPDFFSRISGSAAHFPPYGLVVGGSDGGDARGGGAAQVVVALDAVGPVAAALPGCRVGVAHDDDGVGHADVVAGRRMMMHGRGRQLVA